MARARVAARGAITYEPADTGPDSVTGMSSWAYDARGRVTSETQTMDGSVYTTGYTYRADDQVETTTYPDGEVVTTSYDNRRLPIRLTSPQGIYVNSSSNDAEGRLDLRTFQPGGLQTDYVYYAWNAGQGYGGRLSQILSGVGNGSTGLQNLTYAYDKVGNVTRIRDDNNGGQGQCFDYDPLNRLTNAFIGDANCAPTTVGQGAYSESFAYNAIGNLIKRNGATWEYDAQVTGCATGTSIKPHAIRQAGAYGFTYDCNGNMLTRPEANGVYIQTWNVENRLQAVTVNGQTMAFVYNGDGQRIKRVASDGITYRVGNHYEKFIPASLLTATPAPSATATRTPPVKTKTPSPTRELAMLSQVSSPICTDDSCLLLIETPSTIATRTPTGLPSSTLPSTATATRTSIVMVTSTPTRLMPMSQQIACPSTLTGLMIGNQICPAGGCGGCYLPSDVPYVRRTPIPTATPSRTSTATRTPTATRTSTATPYAVHPPPRRTRTPTATPNVGSVVTKYYYLGGQRVAMRKDGVLYYLLSDHLGSTTVITDQSGNVVSQQLYKPYGEPRWSTGTLPTDRRFTGQRSEEAGLGSLYDYGARFYSPALGRFLSPDTIVPEPGNPQSLNRYSYTLNNPVKYRDPSGHWVESALDIAFIGYDVYDIKTNGLSWTSGLSLAADVAGLILPVATGGGLLVRGLAHVDDLAKAVSHADDVAEVASHADDAVKVVEAAAKEAPIVIGERMTRVRAYADKIGGQNDQ